MALQVIEAAGDTAVDGGNRHRSADAADQRMAGRLWLNSAQADRAVGLRRAR